RNPWNLDFSPGGSSGGSAAALAAGMTTLATGTDIAGSLRVPAAFTGTVAYKPPHGTSLEEGLFTPDWYLVNGPTARTVRDTALMTNSVTDTRAHPHVTDPGAVEPGRLRVAYVPTLGDYVVDDEIRAHTR